MKTIRCYKAQPAVKSEEVESLTIIIDEPVPEFKHESLAAWKDCAKGEAQTICDALCDALPQGVVDALLVELLDRKRSLFVVPMEPKR